MILFIFVIYSADSDSCSIPARDANAGNVMHHFKKDKNLRQLFLILTAFLSSTCFSQSTDTIIKIKNLTVDSGGQLKWTTTNEKPNTKFEIQEYQWNKWDSIGQVNGKGIGDNSYSFLADTSCGLYQIRVCAVENGQKNVKYNSKTIKYPIQKDVKLLGCGINQRFSTKSRFEVYDSKGNKVLHGCSNIIIMENLPRGVYTMNYGHYTSKFIKK